GREATGGGESFENRSRSTQIPSIGAALIVCFPFLGRVDITVHESLIPPYFSFLHQQSGPNQSDLSKCGILVGANSQHQAVLRWIIQQQTSLCLIGSETCLIDALHHFIECLLSRQIDREVTQAHGIYRRRRSVAALPSIESQMVMISTGRNKRHLNTLRHAHHVEAQDAMIEIHGLIDISNM